MSDPFEDWPPTKRDDGKDWSAAQITILKLLWKMEWIDGTTIFEAVQQTYYDRRIRELRESGWQIETHSSKTKYRLISHEKLAGNKRIYPSQKQKQEVSERDNHTCQICKTSDGNLQFDHKIPHERSGQTEVENLQLLCSPCNVEKRGACKHCMLESCEGCPYAYPELFEPRFTIFLDKNTAELLTSDSRGKGIPVPARISEVLSNHYKTLRIKTKK